MALKCCFPGSVLNLANFRIAKWRMIAVFRRKMSIPTTDEYWKPCLVFSSSTESRSGEQSFLVVTNEGGRGDFIYRPGSSKFHLFTQTVLPKYA